MTKKHLRGFTLIELAIVLGVVGVLAAGLFRLMSTSGQQTKDQATAQQHQAIIAAAVGYLAGGQGQGYMQGLNANTAFTIPLPATNASVSDCTNSYNTVVTNGTNFTDMCNYLPPGVSALTENPYGQRYLIHGLKDGALITVLPQTYSVSVSTYLGPDGSIIPDIDGGRISNLIGGDGGFVYAANVCGGPSSNIACGTMNAWTIGTGTYGFSGQTGSVVSRTFISPGTSSSYFWLARVPMPNDATSFSYNTMSTNQYMAPNVNLYMYPFNTPSGGGSIFMNDGTISLNNSTITGNGNVSDPQISLSEDGTTNNNNLINLTTLCTRATGACQAYAINVSQGDVLVTGNVYSVTLYSASDARMKTNIHKLDDPLSDLMKIDAVGFNFKDGGHGSMGVTAQQLEKVYPQLVSTGKDHKFVDYNGLIGPLIGAVQELKLQNDELRKELHQQSEREEKLEQKLREKQAP